MALRQYAPPKVRMVLMTLIQLLAISVIVLQWGYYYLYHSSITTSGALLIFQTGPSEV